MNPLHQAVVEPGTLHRPRSQKWAGFLDLSPELRNRIYEYALVSPPGSLRVHCLQDTCRRAFDSRDPLSPNLLATCCQIHQEATGLLYGGNTFHLRFMFMHAAIDTFFNSIGESRKLIRSIVLEGLRLPTEESSWAALLAQASGLRKICVLMRDVDLMFGGFQGLAACVSELNFTPLKPYEVVSVQMDEHSYLFKSVDMNGEFQEKLKRFCS
ncbi:unnamed protein product [Cercospora beticola]|nr:unnamed protein product [Cercospora beticola]